MRVVAGSCRGRRLVTPEGRDTRPTTDRVREATFNALDSLGVVADARVLDLFSGSGALGIEALSRGAAHCTFVDDDRRALAATTTNLDALGLADRATVVRADGLRFLAGRPTAGPGPGGGAGAEEADGAGTAGAVDAAGAADAFDLALLDPPYAFAGWSALLDALPAAVAVLESDRPIEPPPPWAVVRQKRYGTTLVTLVRRAGSSHAAPADSAPSPS